MPPVKTARISCNSRRKKYFSGLIKYSTVTWVSRDRDSFNGTKIWHKIIEYNRQELHKDKDDQADTSKYYEMLK